MYLVLFLTLTDRLPLTVTCFPGLIVHFHEEQKMTQMTFQRFKQMICIKMPQIWFSNTVRNLPGIVKGCQYFTLLFK